MSLLLSSCPRGWRWASWGFGWFMLMDVAVNVLFPYPKSLSQMPGSLARYFDYGRSIESKLNRLVQQDVESSDPIIPAGWLDPESWQDLPTGATGDDDLLMTVYGMSFTHDVSLDRKSRRRYCHDWHFGFKRMRSLSGTSWSY